MQLTTAAYKAKKIMTLDAPAVPRDELQTLMDNYCLMQVLLSAYRQKHYREVQRILEEALLNQLGPSAANRPDLVN